MSSRLHSEREQLGSICSTYLTPSEVVSEEVAGGDRDPTRWVGISFVWGGGRGRELCGWGEGIRWGWGGGRESGMCVGMGEGIRCVWGGGLGGRESGVCGGEWGWGEGIRCVCVGLGVGNQVGVGGRESGVCEGGGGEGIGCM